MNTDNPLTTLRRDRWIIAGWSFIVSLITLWPFWEGLLRSTQPNAAFMLRDMMVPHDVQLNSLTRSNVYNAPRNIPQDTFLGMLSPALPSTFCCGAIVLFSGIVGGIFAARMVRNMAEGSLFTQLVAAFFVMWNPFTIERLLQGQWSIAAVAMLTPAVAYTIAARRWAAWLFLFVLSAIVPTGAIIATIVSIAFGGRVLHKWLAVGLGVLVSTPWMLPSLFALHNASTGTATNLSSPLSANVFAARAEPGVGTLGALASLGGIWNAEAVPPSLGLIATFAGLIMALLLATRLRELWRVYPSVTIMTLCAVFLPALFATSWGLALMGWLVSHVPGFGLFRDTHKFVCLAIPGYILLFGSLVSALGDYSRRRYERKNERRNRSNHQHSHAPHRNRKNELLQHQLVKTPTTAFIAILMALTVPAFPRDVAPARPQHLSEAWQRMSDIMYAAPLGRTLILPPGSYQQRGENVSYSPAYKMLPGEPLDPAYLIVDGILVDGDPQIISLLTATMRGELHLAEHNIDWVLVDSYLPGTLQPNPDVAKPMAALRQAGFREVVNMDGYHLFRVSTLDRSEPRQLESMNFSGTAGMLINWMCLGVSLGLMIAAYIRRWMRRMDARRLSQAAPVADHEKV